MVICKKIYIITNYFSTCNYTSRGNFMNKGELVSFIASKEKITKADAERALDLTISGILASLAKGNSINLVNFGSFHIKHRKAREGRNPQTGANMKIKAYNQPVFRAGKKMKEACNN